MPRIRTIKPQFFEDDKIGSLTPYGRLCFIGLWTLADDFGTLNKPPEVIKAQLFPYDYNDPELDIHRILQELENLKLIVRYGPNKRYIYIPHFHKHQQIDKPSPTRAAPPPEEFGIPVSPEYAEFVVKAQEYFSRSRRQAPQLVSEKLQEALSKYQELKQRELYGTCPEDVPNVSEDFQKFSEHFPKISLKEKEREKERELEKEREGEMEERGRGFKGEGEEPFLSSPLKASRTENEFDNSAVKFSALEGKNKEKQELTLKSKKERKTEKEISPDLSATCEKESFKKEPAAEFEATNKRGVSSMPKVVGELAAGEPVERGGEVLKLPVVGHPEVRGVVIGRAFVEELERLYPAVDVEQELWEMRGWLIANPDRRKTLRGIKRFITGWLSREQDRAGRRGARDAPVKASSGGEADFLRRLSPAGRQTYEACREVLGLGGDDVEQG